MRKLDARVICKKRKRKTQDNIDEGKIKSVQLNRSFTTYESLYIIKSN